MNENCDINEPSTRTKYGYDAASNRTSLTAPDGSTNNYNYDTLNRLSTLTNSLTGQFGFGYDALSRRTQLTRPNGVSTNYNYDGLSRLLSVLHQTGSTTLDGATYGYDYAGNRTSNTNYLNGITSNYGSDAIHELLHVTQGGGTTESYSYDAVGNRLSSLGISQYSYNASNELTSTSNGSYSYDNNGNTLSDPSGKSYTWDFENRLVSAVVPGTGTVNFKYDPFGRRIFKSSPSFTGIFVYDGVNLIETMNSNGTLVARYTQTENIDEPLAELRSGGSSYYQADGLGSITSLSSSTGTVSNTYTYDSFGHVTNFTGTLSNPFQYAGRESDSETGLYYNRARYYDAASGRFLSEDPIKFFGGMNFYRYVSNDPVDFQDPFGLCPSRNGIDCSKPPASPASPPGTSLSRNMEIATFLNLFASPDVWAALEAPYSAWDYKFHYGHQYAAFGNFNYGASCYAMGLSMTACQRGAGAAAYASAAFNFGLGGHWTAGPGKPFGSPAMVNGIPTYGDQTGWNENPSVIAGYQYAQWQQACQK